MGARKDTNQSVPVIKGYEFWLVHRTCSDIQPSGGAVKTAHPQSRYAKNLKNIKLLLKPWRLKYGTVGDSEYLLFQS